MTIHEFIEWRYRLGLSREAVTELLGVHKEAVTSWELGKSPIEKQTQLATLACELAYIAADQYVQTNPSTLNNLGSKNYVEQQGRQSIRNAIIAGRNPVERELSIILLPKCLIQRKDKNS